MQKMTITLSEEEWRLVARLVYLGETVVNGWRAPRGILGDYAAAAERVYRAYCAAQGGTGAEPNEIADVRDRLYDGVCALLEAYEQDVAAERQRT